MQVCKSKTARSSESNTQNQQDVYYLAFPRDPVRHKALIYGLFLLEAAQTFLLTSSAFRSFATGFGNPNMLDEIDIMWFTVPILGGLGACFQKVAQRSMTDTFNNSGPYRSKLLRSSHWNVVQ